MFLALVKMIVCIISLRGYGFVRIRGRLVSAHRVFRQCIAENVVIICVYIYLYAEPCAAIEWESEIWRYKHHENG